jgi:hypothetical protein
MRSSTVAERAYKSMTICPRGDETTCVWLPAILRGVASAALHQVKDSAAATIKHPL